MGFWRQELWCDFVSAHLMNYVYLEAVEPFLSSAQSIMNAIEYTSGLEECKDLVVCQL